MRKLTKLAALGSLIALLAGGCADNQAAPKPSVTTADITACHDVSDKIILHGSTTSSAELKSLMGEVGLSSNHALRNEAHAMEAAIAAQNANLERSIARRLAATCYELGLTNRSGQPT